jgi:hypothetical protein
MTVIRSQQSVDYRCGQCPGRPDLVRDTEAAAIFDLPLESLQQMFNAGLLHGARTPEGQLLVCSASAAEAAANRKQLDPPK